LQQSVRADFFLIDLTFCNGKIVGAQHFAKAAMAAGAFNPDIEFASPLDSDGHGRSAPDILYLLYVLHWLSFRAAKCEN
jgi:hypothetical protein